MKARDTLERCVARTQFRRERIAYYRICLGLTLKECAARLNIHEKTAWYHWSKVVEKIRQSTTVLRAT